MRGKKLSKTNKCRCKLQLSLASQIYTFGVKMRKSGKERNTTQ